MCKYITELLLALILGRASFPRYLPGRGPANPSPTAPPITPPHTTPHCSGRVTQTNTLPDLHALAHTRRQDDVIIVSSHPLWVDCDSEFFRVSRLRNAVYGPYHATGLPTVLANSSTPIWGTLRSLTDIGTAVTPLLGVCSLTPLSCLGITPSGVGGRAGTTEPGGGCLWLPAVTYTRPAEHELIQSSHAGSYARESTTARGRKHSGCRSRKPVPWCARITKRRRRTSERCCY